MPTEWNSGHLVFDLSVTLSVSDSCHSVTKKTKKQTPLTLVITFEPQEIETSYLECILNKWNPFNSFQGQCQCDLDRYLYTKNSKFWTLMPSGIHVSQIHLFLFFVLWALNRLRQTLKRKTHQVIFFRLYFIHPYLRNMRKTIESMS